VTGFGATRLIGDGPAAGQHAVRPVHPSGHARPGLWPGHPQPVVARWAGIRGPGPRRTGRRRGGCGRAVPGRPAPDDVQQPARARAAPVHAVRPGRVVPLLYLAGDVHTVPGPDGWTVAAAAWPRWRRRSRTGPGWTGPPITGPGRPGRTGSRCAPSGTGNWPRRARPPGTGRSYGLAHLAIAPGVPVRTPCWPCWPRCGLRTAGPGSASRTAPRGTPAVRGRRRTRTATVHGSIPAAARTRGRAGAQPGRRVIFLVIQPTPGRPAGLPD